MSGRNVRRNLGLSPESELTPFFTQIYRNPQTFTQNPRTFYEIAQANNTHNLRFTLNSVIGLMFNNCFPSLITHLDALKGSTEH